MEYRAISLTFSDEINNEMIQELNKWFKDGWEYVESITQPVATGSNYSTRFGSVVVILRKSSPVKL